MRVSRSFLFLVAAGVSVQATSIVRADDVLAADNAANYIPGGGWNATNNNQGTGTPGFGIPGYPSGWIFAGGTEQLSSNDPSTAQWELDAEANGFASAQRYFPAIDATGGYITLDINATSIDTNAFVGVGFSDQTGPNTNTQEFSLMVHPGNTTSDTNKLTGEDYFIDAFGNDIDTGLAADGVVVHLFLAITPTGYSVVLQQGSNTVPISVDTGLPSEINNVSFIDFGSGPTDTIVDFNNLTVVPLPTAAMAATPLLAILAIGKLKRR